MANSWEHHISSDSPREFLVSVELYISNAAGVTLRKVRSHIFRITLA